MELEQRKDAAVVAFIQINDQFLFAFESPCYRRATLSKLEEYYRTHGDALPTVSREEIERKDKDRIMAIKLVKEQEAPKRLHVRSGVAMSQEYYDVVAAIRTLPLGQAVVVTLESEQFTKADAKKPEVGFAYTLRRYFHNENMAAVAYQTGKLEVTVRRLTAEEIAAAKRRKVKQLNKAKK
jgi:hypothetical protein